MNSNQNNWQPISQDRNSLKEAEAAAVAESEFDEPEGLTGKFADSGYVDEETVYLEEVEDGAGANAATEGEILPGMHVEEPSDKQ